MDDLGNNQHAASVTADRTKPAVDKFASFLERNTKRVAYGIAVLAWLTLGFVAWFAILLGGMVILLSIILFKLVAGLPINRDIRRFLFVLQFWPDGFSSLSSAFRDGGEPDVTEAQDEAIFVFTTLRVIYVIAIIYLIACFFQNTNPLTYVFYLPGNAVMAVILIAILTLGISWLADRRKRNGSIYSPASSSADTQLHTGSVRDTEASDMSREIKSAEVADSSGWTGRP
jgi:hypothetical protein